MVIDPTTEEGHNIASALRGPDVDILTFVKELTTAVLRHFVGYIGHFCSAHAPREARRIWREIIPSEREEARKAYQTQHHFRAHFKAGMLALAEVSPAREEIYAHLLWVEDVLGEEEL
jgi:hypothetical protein